jgi:hypothetical protein
VEAMVFQFGDVCHHIMFINLNYVHKLETIDQWALSHIWALSIVVKRKFLTVTSLSRLAEKSILVGYWSIFINDL